MQSINSSSNFPTKCMQSVHPRKLDCTVQLHRKPLPRRLEYPCIVGLSRHMSSRIQSDPEVNFSITTFKLPLYFSLFLSPTPPSPYAQVNEHGRQRTPHSAETALQSPRSRTRITNLHREDHSKAPPSPTDLCPAHNTNTTSRSPHLQENFTKT